MNVNPDTPGISVQDWLARWWKQRRYVNQAELNEYIAKRDAAIAAREAAKPARKPTKKARKR